MGKKRCYTVLLLLVVFLPLRAQDDALTPLFADREPIHILLHVDVSNLKEITSDSIFTTCPMLYKENPSQTWDSIEVDLRARGNYRRQNCYFPPLRIHIDKSQSKGTPFAGNKSLKLVLPCEYSPLNNNLILREYLCYELYEAITPYHFDTRRAIVTLIETGLRQRRSYQLNGFFIEDDDHAAKRLGGKSLQEAHVHPLNLHDTLSTIHDFFQFMIANTDWSARAQHNINVLFIQNKFYVPLPYDFDMSGIVNAPYAAIEEMLKTSSAKDRVYRGFCRPPEVFQKVREYYLHNESDVMAVFDINTAGLEGKDIHSLKVYVSGYYAILKNDKMFKSKIVIQCREK